MMIYSMVMQIEYIQPPDRMYQIIKISPLQVEEVPFGPLTCTILVKGYAATNSEDR